MPDYSFKCCDCNYEFVLYLRIDQYTSKPSCPKCQNNQFVQRNIPGKTHKLSTKKHKKKIKKSKIKRKINYYTYIESGKWKRKRKKFIKKAKNTCMTCKEKCLSQDLRIHHKHYKTLGRESYNDIIVMCWECHNDLHNIPFAIDKEYQNIIKETI